MTKFSTILRSPDSVKHAMLDRLASDCNYYTGYGFGCDKHLWAGSVSEQIALMNAIYDSLTVKPNWLSKDDINGYYLPMMINVKKAFVTAGYREQQILKHPSAVRDVSHYFDADHKIVEIESYTGDGLQSCIYDITDGKYIG